MGRKFVLSVMKFFPDNQCKFFFWLEFVDEHESKTEERSLHEDPSPGAVSTISACYSSFVLEDSTSLRGK